MPAPRKVDLLPPDVRRELDARLVQSGFSGYCALSDWLAEQGLEIGKTALHQYGQEYKHEFHDTLRRLRIAGYMAEQIDDDLENALDKTNSVRLRDKLFEEITALEELDATDDPERRAKLINMLSLSQARLSRAGVLRQKWVAEIKTKLDALLTDAQTGDNTLDIQTLQRIRREVYGLA
jgi:hypothetical protein